MNEDQANVSGSVNGLGMGGGTARERLIRAHNALVSEGSPHPTAREIGARAGVGADYAGVLLARIRGEGVLPRGLNRGRRAGVPNKPRRPVEDPVLATIRERVAALDDLQAELNAKLDAIPEQRVRLLTALAALEGR